MNTKNNEIFQFKADDIIFKEGDESNGIYVIQQGTVEIFRLRQGAEIQLSILRVGEVIGTMTMLTKSQRTASAKAIDGPCVLAYYPNESLKDSFKQLPVWAQAVIKDTIARVKDVDEKLVDSKLREKSLLKSLGTTFHHSAQLSYLLASFIRKGTVSDDTKVPLFPIKDFLVQAEFILLKKYSYIEKIHKIFISNCLLNVIQNQKYGLVIVKPNASLYEDYANFALSVAKKGTNYFVPFRLYKWMHALVRISKKFNNLERFGKEQLFDFLNGEMGRPDSDIVMRQLVHYDVVSDNGSTIHFSPTKIQKTIIFESIARDLKDVKF